LPASNISPPAFFRVIEDMSPTLLIDEADTFLHRSDQLHGILNAGYKKKTAYVLRVAAPAPGSGAGAGSGDKAGSKEVAPGIEPATGGAVTRFSCWCPKVIAQIGRLPGTLADRCIVIRMQRKTPNEQCDRLRDLEVKELKERCAKFLRENQHKIATARPAIPGSLSDRAGDIWEPLFVIADLAGTEWGQRARQAAEGLAAAAQDSSPIASLLLDIFITFCVVQADRIFSRVLVENLNNFGERPWTELRDGRPSTDRWLSRQLRPYGVRPKTIWIKEEAAKGYLKEDFAEVFQRYVSESDLDHLRADLGQPPSPDEGQEGEAA
jgi:hypothetical protein